MTPTNQTTVNKFLNDIHRWGEPDQHPATRMFLTRLGGTVCVVAELASSVAAAIKLGNVSAQAVATLAARAARFTFPGSDWLAKKADRPPQWPIVKEAFMELCRLVSGFASTLFFGVVFSPEINFRWHLKLGLATNDLDAKRARETAAKLQAEVTMAEVARAREVRYNQFVEAREAKSKTEVEKNRIDSRLSDLLCPAS